MDDADLAILKAVQEGFPLSARPYEVLAKELGVPAAEVFRRVGALRRQGVIRRIGPLFDARRLGLRGRLVAVRAADSAVDAVADLLDGHAEVTHNYLRTGPFNVWFTVMAGADDEVERLVAEVRALPGVAEVVTLATRRVFKLDASFRVGTGSVRSGGAGPRPAAPARRELPADAASLDEADRRIIAACSPGLADSETPWADAAAVVGVATDELLARLERMKRAGVLRAVRAVLDPRRLGLEGHVLVAWEVPDGRADDVGSLFASREEVSHCVLREPAPGWPYTLYTMVHARSLERAGHVVDEMAQAGGVRRHVRLETLRELKKSSPRYF